MPGSPSSTLAHTPQQRSRLVRVLARAACAFLLAAGPCAWGQELPLGFSWGPVESIEHDSNLLRASGAPGTAPIVAETLISSALQGNFHETYDREDVSASALIGRVLFRDLRSFDYTEENLQAKLQSALPYTVNLVVGAGRSAQLAHYADVGLAVRDVIDTDSANVSLDFPLHVDWRGVLYGYDTHTTNSATIMSPANNDTVEGDVGLRYQPSTGNHIDFLLHEVSSRFPEANLASLINPGYHEHGVDLRVDWTLSGASHLAGHAGWVRRSYEPLYGSVTPIYLLIDPALTLDRDFAGPVYELTYDWQPSGATTLSAYAARQTGAAGDNNYLSAVSRIFRLTATWQPREKLRLQAYGEDDLRNYFSYVYQIIYGLPSGTVRLDHSQEAGVRVVWAPRRWFEGVLDIHREQRDSSIDIWKYSDSAVSLTAQFTFD
jgi:hypothetical protein